MRLQMSHIIMTTYKEMFFKDKPALWCLHMLTACHKPFCSEVTTVASFI